jgi:hypothetical protein
MNLQEIKRGWRGKLWVYLQDEAPRIGAGWRRVEVHVGDKGVRLKVPGSTRSSKLPRAIFNTIAKDARK